MRSVATGALKFRDAAQAARIVLLTRIHPARTSRAPDPHPSRAPSTPSWRSSTTWKGLGPHHGTRSGVGEELALREFRTPGWG